MNCREPIVVAGLDIADRFLPALDREVRIERWRGRRRGVAAGPVLLRLDGNARAMLAPSARRSTRSSICRGSRP